MRAGPATRSVELPAASNASVAAAAVSSASGLESCLEPGRNCWRVERAHRVAFLVDGAEYFGAIRAALAKARHSIFIIGWDIDSRMRLVPSGAQDGLPEPLGDFLNAVVARNRELRGYVLSWDFAMLYAMEREWLPIYKFDWRTHRRLSFRLDDRHPVGASHHQKIIVVDDAVAFVSGYDLTRARWDTSEHLPDDARRTDHSGESYPPFHDVGIVVEGACAKALGELAASRWERASGHPPEREGAESSIDPWPDGVIPALTDVDVAIARTEPAFDGRPGVGEIRALYLDAIARARRHVVAENQYFTSQTIADALADRLARDDAPEIAVISSFAQSGWLETSTMGVIRARNHQVLRAADRHRRYRMYCPSLPGLDDGNKCLNVHSKVLIADDDLLMIGSANLSDRSLGMDTECNLAIQSRGDATLRRAFAALRERLLAEHLGCKQADVATALGAEQSLHGAIRRLTRRGERTLVAFEPELDRNLDLLVPDARVIDPETPIDPDTIVADLVPHEQARLGARARLIALALSVIALAAMALAWRYTPLREWLELDRLAELGSAWREAAWAPLAVLLAFVGGGLVVFPLLMLIAVTAMVFGPVLGPIYSLLGALASAAITFAIGRHLGRETVRRLAGQRVNELSRRLGTRGLLTVAFVRMLPIAPFTIVNVVAGASHIRWSDFLLGTVIGLLPGVTTMTFFVDRAIAAIRDPGTDTFGLLALASLAVVGLAWMLRHLLRARGPVDTEAAPATHGS